MYKCKYFKIEELVHPDLLPLGEEKLWSMFDERILMVADWIREKYGVCTVNEGNLVNCGLRKMDTNVGAKMSQHKFGRALDIHIKKIDNAVKGQERIDAYNEVRKVLLEELPEWVNFENNVSWLHVDTGVRPRRLFNP